MSFDVIPRASKKDLVATLSADCIDHELVGDILWVIVDDIPGDIIVCFSMAATEDGWGYKQIYELDRPFHYSCPLRFLDRTRAVSRSWRRRVRAFHQSKASEPAANSSPPAP